MINMLKVREDRVLSKDVEFYWDEENILSIFIDNEKIEDIVVELEPKNLSQANLACIEIYQKNIDRYRKIADGVQPIEG